MQRTEPQSTAEHLVLVEGGQPRCAIMVGPSSSAFLRWVAGELQRYLGLLSGAQVPILVDQANAQMRTYIVLGGPESNPMAHACLPALAEELRGLTAGGFVLKTVAARGQNLLVVAGHDEAGTMYAAYDLLERLGIVFQMTRDILPERKSDLTVEPLAVRCQPALPRRGHHLRHFVTPWMSADYLCGYLDQLAKLKCNYLEFYWYEGGPWVEYAYRGEQRLIGDLYTRESGYTSWRSESYGFNRDDIVIGREVCAGQSLFAPEFAACKTPEEAHHAARDFLRKVIDHAHQRKIEVWLGAGDCPFVPVNLGRYSGRPPSMFGIPLPPGDPAGAGIWAEILSSMITTYPQADGYWLWLAEVYLSESDAASRAVLQSLEQFRPLLPDGAALRPMGYDLYVAHKSDAELTSDALVQLHYAKTVTDLVRARFPKTRLGVSLLGRSYLFPALHALLPRDVALQSMEAAICWNRNARVPMENFAAAAGRDVFLVPRLDDDENEMAAQFNVSLYQHDRVNRAPAFGITGVAPQVGKIRGLEHNARFLAESAWSPGLAPAAFYEAYTRRLFGDAAAGTLLQAYLDLEATDMFLGLEVPADEVGHCFCGIGNFLNYADSRDINDLKSFRLQSQPLDGPAFPGWNISQEAEAPRMKQYGFRTSRFREAIERYEGCLELLRSARPALAAGAAAAAELEYLICKTEAFVLHLKTLCALMSGHVAYDAAFRARRQGRGDEAGHRFDECEHLFGAAVALAEATARRMISGIDDPTERHILFRYNVRFVVPLREFGKYIRNICNYHRGLPYWESPDWTLIDPPCPPM